MSTTKSPSWLRFAQIGLGAIAIILSIYILTFPGLALVSVVFIIGIILLIVGIERVLSGIFVPNKSRWASVGLGILVIILSLIVIEFPIGTTVFLIILLAVALLFNGIARVVHGISDKQRHGWERGFSIVVGVIAIALSVLIMASPLFGAVLAGIMIGIALLITGIQIIASGIAGKQRYDQSQANVR
jgi:uncharacterized membrane protein HdeD (DUF308 family)